MISEDTGETVVSDAEPDDETRRLLHRTIDGVRTDYAEMAYNTAIAKLIVLTNHLTKSGAPVPRSVAEPLVLMTAPLAPHISEEMWQRLGHAESLAHGPFPDGRPGAAGGRRDRVPDPGQGQGAVADHRRPPTRRRTRCSGPHWRTPRIVELLAGATPRKVVVVPGRMVSIVP